MILFPSVDELLKHIDSRYSLVMLASKRANELDAGAANIMIQASQLGRPLKRFWLEKLRSILIILKTYRIKISWINKSKGLGQDCHWPLFCF